MKISVKVDYTYENDLHYFKGVGDLSDICICDSAHSAVLMKLYRLIKEKLLDQGYQTAEIKPHFTIEEFGTWFFHVYLTHIGNVLSINNIITLDVEIT
ncbi:MAG: hypothetical protein COA52_00370 [Hyphomicrobiales bacterium]|nr:MAG: hypothetical protein COA52_00370 [Hyphomicrobiales bacterium]